MIKDEALRLALDWMEKVSHHTPTEFDNEGIDVAEKICAALEAKDEPVAWLRTSGTGSPVVTEALLAEMPEMRWNFQQPLYAHPQQADKSLLFDSGVYAGSHVGKGIQHTSLDHQPWVKLTDSEIGTIAYNVNPLDGVRTFARAIEAKLKEKNT